MSKPVILTGIRANNDLTIGNYLGALLPIVDMAKQQAGKYQVNLFVPDLHSFTTPIDHSQLQAQIMQNLRIFAAAGLPLDHDDVHIYRQSYVPAHSELTWILDCFTGMGEMGRMTQYKDKSTNLEKAKDALAGTQRVSVGLFNYPVLMAADILLYNASYVPVGEDQTQHLEFTRDIASRLNNQFGELFTVPLPVPKQHEFFGKEQGLRIKDLQDPTKKMSKSDETGKGVIFMSDAPELATKKVMSAATDSLDKIAFDPKDQPGITNLLQIMALLSGRSQQEVNNEWIDKERYGDFKKAVAVVVSDFLQDFHTKLSQVDDAHIAAKLERSEALMNQTANATLLRAQKAVGLR
jgi:tryptophanyl-tRNA synthetase